MGYNENYIFSKNVPKKPSFLKRDLDARAHSEAYRLQFRLPGSEKLDGSIDATLWTPYNKRYVWGKIFLSQNYLCFESRVSVLINTKLRALSCNTCGNSGKRISKFSRTSERSAAHRTS